MAADAMWGPDFKKRLTPAMRCRFVSSIYAPDCISINPVLSCGCSKRAGSWWPRPWMQQALDIASVMRVPRNLAATMPACLACLHPKMPGGCAGRLRRRQVSPGLAVPLGECLSLNTSSRPMRTNGPARIPRSLDLRPGE